MRLHPSLETLPVAMLIFSISSFAGCGGGSSSNAALRPQGRANDSAEVRLTQVVCTTGPVTDLVRSIGGPHLSVTGLMGPGVDPHLYRERPSDIERLANADIVFYNGLHLEGRMADTLEKLGERKPTFAVTHDLVASQDQRLRKPAEFEGYYDPHVWHDARLWSDCATYVAQSLSEYDPAHRDDYLKNLATYREELLEADQYSRRQLATIPEAQRVLVTAHDAFGYFCPAYGLTPMPLKGISTEEEITIGRMDEVINFLVDRKISAVFVETAVAPQIVSALIRPCKQKGLDVHIGGELYADALGPIGSGAETTAGMIRANVDTIVAALAGGAKPASED